MDSNAVLYAYLTQMNTALYLLCGTRIYIPRIPQGFDNSSPSIELFSSGTGWGCDKVHTDVVADYTAKCYGGTSDHGVARQVYSALVDRLHRAEMQRTAHGVIACAYQQIDGQDLFDPDAGWPYVLTAFRIRMHP